MFPGQQSQQGNARTQQLLEQLSNCQDKGEFLSNLNNVQITPGNDQQTQRQHNFYQAQQNKKNEEYVKSDLEKTFKHNYPYNSPQYIHHLPTQNIPDLNQNLNVNIYIIIIILLLKKYIDPEFVRYAPRYYPYDSYLNYQDLNKIFQTYGTTPHNLFQNYQDDLLKKQIDYRKLYEFQSPPLSYPNPYQTSSYQMTSPPNQTAPFIAVQPPAQSQQNDLQAQIQKLEQEIQTIQTNQQNNRLKLNQEIEEKKQQLMLNDQTSQGDLQAKLSEVYTCQDKIKAMEMNLKQTINLQNQPTTQQHLDMQNAIKYATYGYGHPNIYPLFQNNKYVAALNLAREIDYNSTYHKMSKSLQDNEMKHMFDYGPHFL